MNIINTGTITKMCHARPGDVVTIKGKDYIVCAEGSLPRELGPKGLYTLREPEHNVKVFLVHLGTGMASAMPVSLSTSIIIHRNASVILNQPEMGDLS